MTQLVPANIITGFLGTGKTTAILHLLKNKPTNQNWAILVNEFGEIGIDGTLLSGQGAMVKEVPGGCMCCTAGVPMSVALTALLRQKPDRLLIEPTGLGHPKEVISVLQSDQYKPYIDLKATITLADPRHFSDPKYTSHQNFRDQLACADIIIGNKIDLCQSQDINNFRHWVTQQFPDKNDLQLTRNGQINPVLLEQKRMTSATGAEADNLSLHHHHAMEPGFLLAPDQKYIRKENMGEGFFSCGWIFGAELTFGFDLLFSLLSQLTAERVKAVMNTDKGCFALNVHQKVISVNEMSLEGFESRIEVIDSQPMPWDELEQILLEIAGIPPAQQ